MVFFIPQWTNKFHRKAFKKNWKANIYLILFGSQCDGRCLMWIFLNKHQLVENISGKLVWCHKISTVNIWTYLLFFEQGYKNEKLENVSSSACFIDLIKTSISYVSNWFISCFLFALSLSFWMLKGFETAVPSSILYFYTRLKASNTHNTHHKIYNFTFTSLFYFIICQPINWD